MITIAIPTFNRGEILVKTLEQLLALPVRADAIVIADQTLSHPLEVQRRLEEWSDGQAIRWIRLTEPSIPRAMNAALVAANTPLVLFLDDDIVPSASLIERHRAAHEQAGVWAVAGQVLQPGEEPRDIGSATFRFHHNGGRFINDVMAGNLSVKRERALEIGGFDENFIGAAYRFESDFAQRLVNMGGRIWFEPKASIRHLQVPSGGIRSYGDHRTSLSPLHSVGDYYFALHHEPAFWRYAARRLQQNVMTRHHLRHPWTIPGKLIGELRGYLVAKRLVRRGRKLIGQS